MPWATRFQDLHPELAAILELALGATSPCARLNRCPEEIPADGYTRRNTLPSYPESPKAPEDVALREPLLRSSSGAEGNVQVTLGSLVPSVLDTSPLAHEEGSETLHLRIQMSLCFMPWSWRRRSRRCRRGDNVPVHGCIYPTRPRYHLQAFDFNCMRMLSIVSSLRQLAATRSILRQIAATRHRSRGIAVAYPVALP